jgi:hypothetical protein
VNSWGIFHVLDVSSIPAFEFARALGQLVPTLAWRQQMRWFSISAAPSAIPSEVIELPLQRGYAHLCSRHSSSFTAPKFTRSRQWTRRPYLASTRTL